MNLCYCKSCMQPLKEETVCPHCGQTVSLSSPAHHLKCGTILKEKYLVGMALGEGGFGITYIGRDLTLDMRIAIKEYYPNGCANRSHNFSNEVTMTQGGHGIDYEKDMRRFLSEARILARFSNEPGVVCVRDYFQENGTAYIVMEYLDGVTLKNYIAKFGPIPADTFIPMIDPILQVLGDIHKQGLIHRDISPDNIMMLKSGRLKLLDFGAAREVTGDKSLSVVLKPGYAPEEQYRSKGKQGSWTDVYAMCATIYKCITGVTPDESMQRVFEDELKPPSALGVSIPASQETALMQGLSVKSSDRIQTIDALRKAFLPEGTDDIKSIHIHRTDSHSEEKVDEQDIKTKYQSKSDKTVSNAGSGDVTIQQDPAKISETGADVERQTNAAEEKTLYQPVVNTNGETNNTASGGADIVQPETKETPDKHSSAIDTDNERDHPIKEEPIMVEGVTGKKIKPLFIAIGGVAVAIIVAVIILVASIGKTPEVNIHDKLPTEREMASDCSTVLRNSGINGGVLDLQVQSENLNEKFKMFTVVCDVSVQENGASKQYTVKLHYEYEDKAWVLSTISGVENHSTACDHKWVSVEENTFSLISVRRITIPVADQSDDAKAEAHSIANSIMSEWTNSGSTEESFSALAQKYSKDANAANGGLYENVYDGQFTDAVNAWCFNEIHSKGDCAIVQSEGEYVLILFLSGGEYRIDSENPQYCTACNETNGKITPVT